MSEDGYRYKEPEDAPKDPLPELLEDSFDLLWNDLVAPLFKFVGGKGKLAPTTRGMLPKDLKGYVEPFVGGGATYFDLVRNGRLPTKCWLNDFDEHLIWTYEEVVSDPADVHRRLMTIMAEYDKAPSDVYYWVREQWNRRKTSAAKQIFLRQTAFNGLWRMNKKGQMNSPFGQYAKPAMPSLEKLQAVAAALKKADLFSMDFAEFFAHAESEFMKPGCAVYCDPPYDETFTAYTKEGFSKAQQEQLIQLCAKWAQAGATMIYSNADTPFIRECFAKHWPSAKIDIVKMARNINSDGKGRGKVGEILASEHAV